MTKSPLPMSTIPEHLLSAYRSTQYRVFSAPPFILRVDEPSEAMGKLYRSNGVTSAAFITTWNPMSIEASAAANIEANKALLDAIEETQLIAIDGFGAWPNDPTKGEESFLELGIDLQAATNLATRFQQAAFLFVGPDRVPRVILAPTTS